MGSCPGDRLGFRASRSDLAPGEAGSGPAGYAVAPRTVFFAADDRVTGRDLWAIDLADLGIPFDRDDLDLDGFSNAVEEAVGTSTTDAGDTPFGGHPAGDPVALDVRKTRIGLRFDREEKDTVELEGRLPVAAGFEPEGERVIVDLGGVIRVFVLNRKGKGKLADGSRFKLKLRRRNGVVKAKAAAKFTLKLAKDDYAAAFADEGLTGETTVERAPRLLRVLLFHDGRCHRRELTLRYDVEAGERGKAR